MGMSICIASLAEKRIFQYFIAGLLIAFSAFAFALRAQETPQQIEAKHAAYYLCINNIEIKPREAYKYCSDYLKKYPGGDERLVEFATMFTTAYEKIDGYLNSVPANDFIDGPKWSIYKPDLQQVIPGVDESKDKHKIEISRSYASSDEEKLLGRAEAVYGPRQDGEKPLFKQWRYFSQVETDLPRGEPRWWSGRIDTVLADEIVTTSAVMYYYQLSQQLRVDDDRIKPNSFRFTSTDLKYTATIKRMPTYSHAGKTFKDAYVAEMNLTWGQVCGPLCGYGFTRNKIVVLAAGGDILDGFLDDPVNSSSWIS
jgi:hypothetical protein